MHFFNYNIQLSFKHWHVGAGFLLAFAAARAAGEDRVTLEVFREDKVE